MSDDIREKTQQLFREVFGDDEIELFDEMSAEDVEGWDSIAHINLIVSIEKQFGIKFAMAEIAGLQEKGQNVGGLLRLIEKKLGKGG